MSKSSWLDIAPAKDNYMKPTNCKIFLSGIKIPKDSYLEIDQLLKKLERCTPAGSNLRLRLSNHENSFTGNLAVQSNSFKFEANSSGTQPILVVKDVILLLRAQIRVFMQQRVF